MHFVMNSLTDSVVMYPELGDRFVHHKTGEIISVFDILKNTLLPTVYIMKSSKPYYFCLTRDELAGSYNYLEEENDVNKQQETA